MRARALWALTFVVGASGCNTCGSSSDGTPTAAKDAGTTNATCERRTTERLGIPFVKVCPQDLGSVGAAFDPFWIAAAPLDCSAGEHRTLRCPSVVALRHPAMTETRLAQPLSARLAVVVEADDAQSICYMRFAGRLATRDELARAEAAMGLAAMMVARVGAPPHFDFVRLSEWVTATACETPGVEKCSPMMFPSGAQAPIPWGSIASCDAKPIAPDAGAALLAVGESCPASSFAWADAASSPLPCAVRTVAMRAGVAGFSLSCRPPAVDERRLDADIPTTAAFRCVVPEATLFTGSGARP